MFENQCCEAYVQSARQALRDFVRHSDMDGAGDFDTQATQLLAAMMHLAASDEVNYARVHAAAVAQFRATRVQAGQQLPEWATAQFPLEDLGARLVAVERSALPLQSRAHPLLVEALGGNAVADLVGSSRRFLRSAVTVAASMGMSSDSIDEVVSSALQEGEPMLMRKTAVGESLVALAGLASAAGLVVNDAGEVVLARMEKDRDYKPLFSLDKPLELPF